MLHMVNRSCKVGQVLKKEISVIVQYSLRDPRLNNIITVSNVQLSRDLSHAKIFVSFLNEKEEIFLKKSINILNHASSFIRSLLSKTTKLRIIPKLIFIYDNSFIEGMHIDALINSAIKKNK
ncbi:MAG TPA: 30S ribosome-binding factor RbfA [Buchnera sp. (in: enterobacteria)]|nr:30S ribosome-binding factor RbfA [Buchnera sp. (in: enterobacteria)]